MATQLSKYFTLAEALASQTALVNGFMEQFNPPVEVVNNLTALHVNVLDPVRELVGVPVTESSGYRCPRLNTKVGGEPGSQHPKGEAADIRAQGYTPDDLYAKIKASDIAFDQLIIEHDLAGDRWVHISYNVSGEQRGECMKGELQPGGGTVCVNDGVGSFKTNAA